MANFCFCSNQPKQQPWWSLTKWHMVLDEKTSPLVFSWESDNSTVMSKSVKKGKWLEIK